MLDCADTVRTSGAKPSIATGTKSLAVKMTIDGQRARPSRVAEERKYGIGRNAHDPPTHSKTKYHAHLSVSVGARARACCFALRPRCITTIPPVIRSLLTQTGSIPGQNLVAMPTG